MTNGSLWEGLCTESYKFFGAVRRLLAFAPAQFLMQSEVKKPHLWCT